MAVGSRNTEVADLPCRTQSRYLVICSTAVYIRTFLREAGIGVGRADLSDWCLVGNRHLSLRYTAIERTHNTGNLCIANQRGHIPRSSWRVMCTIRTNVILWI